VDVDRRGLAEQLDDVVTGLRRLTLDRRGLSLTAAATLATLRRSGPARLTDQGLVQRRTDPDDRRAVLITVTPAGAELLRRRREDRATRLAGPLQGLDDDDVRAITAALPALARLAGV
jgi:hypothetical protein